MIMKKLEIARGGGEATEWGAGKGWLSIFSRFLLCCREILLFSPNRNYVVARKSGISPQYLDTAYSHADVMGVSV